MALKQMILGMIPASVKTRLKHSLDARKLQSIPASTADTTNLMSQQGVSLSAVFNAAEINDSWKAAEKQMARFNVPDKTGGVNPGDRRAIFYLIRKFKVLSVLETGTHIGASSIHIAAALYKNKEETGRNISFTTVDIRDVNDLAEKPWLKYGTKHSPAQMIQELGYASHVKFVQHTAKDFFAGNTQKFDLIFLDGDHSAAGVYQEIPLALKTLNPNGMILLHDFYPNSKALWPVDNIIEGPFMATERLIKEGANIVVLPLGELPWITKHNSTVTSLALLMKK